MIMMSNKVLVCFIVFLIPKTWFGEKNQVAISNIEEDILTLKKPLKVRSPHPPR